MRGNFIYHSVDTELLAVPDVTWCEVMVKRKGLFFRSRTGRRRYIPRKKQSSSGLGLRVKVVLFRPLREEHYTLHRTVMFCSGVEHMSVDSVAAESRTGIDSDIELNRPVTPCDLIRFPKQFACPSFRLSFPLHVSFPCRLRCSISSIAPTLTFLSTR
jgi:hypothetical protein